MFLLSERQGIVDPVTNEVVGSNEEDIARRALAAWIDEQDSANGKATTPNTFQ